MARWKKGYTSAVTNTQKVGKSKTQIKPWKSHGSNDRFIWGSCILIALFSGLFWIRMSPKNHSESITALDDMGTENKLGEDAEAAGESDKTFGLSPYEQINNDDEPSLMWWIESAPLPDRFVLQNCLARDSQPLPELFMQNQGFSILTQGRDRPQTIFERNEQIWVKTPLLSSPHQQAYDHLLLVSCLQAPGATLYDPLLVRQWGGDAWPKKNKESGGIALDELFVIRSQDQHHFTYGLHRLGLPDLGIISATIDGRDLLQRLALFWIVDQDSRQHLQSKEPQFTFNDFEAKLIEGTALPQWLGPKSAKVLVNTQNIPFDESDVKKILNTQNIKSASDRQKLQGKKRRVKRVKRSVTTKSKVKLKRRRTKTDKKPQQKRARPKLPKLQYR
jgi:hypothetical protein